MQQQGKLTVIPKNLEARDQRKHQLLRTLSITNNDDEWIWRQTILAITNTHVFNFNVMIYNYHYFPINDINRFFSQQITFQFILDIKNLDQAISLVSIMKNFVSCFENEITRTFIGLFSCRAYVSIILWKPRARLLINYMI